MKHRRTTSVVLPPSKLRTHFTAIGCRVYLAQLKKHGQRFSRSENFSQRPKLWARKFLLACYSNCGMNHWRNLTVRVVLGALGYFHFSVMQSWVSLAHQMFLSALHRIYHSRLWTTSLVMRVDTRWMQAHSSRQIFTFIFIVSYKSKAPKTEESNSSDWRGGNNEFVKLLKEERKKKKRKEPVNKQTWTQKVRTFIVYIFIRT